MYSKYFKHILDLIFAVILAFLTAPVGLVIAILIKLESDGPVLFLQKRTGLNGKTFTLFKFRSMASNNNLLDSSCQDKITRTGKFLRMTSLDELPQLINVLRGEMSFIGPRPWIPEYFNNMNSMQRRRNEVLPGITGLSQAYGRNNLSINQKITFDLEYVKQVSLLRDIKIVLKTIKVLFYKSEQEAGKQNIINELLVLQQQNLPPNEKNLKDRNESVKNNAYDLISIVVPVYNASEFIEATIASVQNQTYKTWELLLVDDCSTDNSIAIIQKHQELDSRIRLMHMKMNSGAALSRNLGTESAKGRYICFLDADDLWHRDKLAMQVQFMKEHDCEFSFTGYEFADAAGVPSGTQVHVPESIDYRSALKNTTIWTSTVMFDMNKLKKSDVLMPNVGSEDTATWWGILKKIDKAYGMPGIWAYYRRTGGTLSANKLTAIKRTWNLYTKVEQLNVLYSFYNFIWYCFNATRRRI